MPTQDELDAEATQSDLAGRVAELEAWRDLMIRNILGPAQFRPGLLRFGGNIMQLDNQGIQIQTPTPATADVPAIYWVNELNTSPSTVDPLVTLGGRADPSTATYPNGIFTFKLRAENAERYAQIAHTIGATGTNQISMKIWNSASAPGGAEPEFGISDTGSVQNIFFSNADTITINAIPLLLGRFTSDPTLNNGGQVWFDSATTKFRGYDGSSALNFLLEGDVSGMNKVTGSGYLVMPAAASGIDPAVGAGNWTSGAWSQVLASTSEADSIIGMIAECNDATNALAEFEVDIGTGGAGSETVVATIPFTRGGVSLAGVITSAPTFFPAPIEVATSTRVAVRYRTSDTTVELKNMKLIYAKASELVAR